MWCIYKHTNKINGKVYIGQTCQDVNSRWGRNGQNYDPSYKFGKAIQKYGWNNFTHEIIEDNIPTQELANQKEIYYIELYQSYYFGYNMTKGGGGIINDAQNIGVYQIDINKNIVAHYKSIIDASKATNLLPQNIGACLTNKQITAGGFYWLSDTIDTNNIILPKSKYKRDVISIEPNSNKISYYSCVQQASKETNTSYSGILLCCNKQAIMANNRYWVYLDEYDDNWEPTVLSTKKCCEWFQKAIVCVETGEVWGSITDCSIETGILTQNLSQNCCKQHKTAKNKHYAYLSEYNENWLPAEEYNTDKRRAVSGRSKPVYCLETNEIYCSASEAGRQLNISNRLVSKCCIAEISQTHGYHFKYVEVKNE